MNFDIGAFSAGLRGENVGEYKAKQLDEEHRKKEQARQEKQWEREDQMQAELDALDSKYKKPSAEEQRKKYDTEQSIAKTAADVVANPAANGIVPGVPQTEVKPVGFSSEVAANAAQNGINVGASPIVNKAKPSIGDFTPKQPEFKPVENTFIDTLNHAADRLAIKAKYGKADETAQVQMMSAIKKLKEEGADDAVAQFHAGNFEAGLEGFNQVGEHRGAQIVGTPQQSTYEYAGQKMPTTIVQLQMPDGKIETINTAQYGAMRFKADQALKLAIDAAQAAQTAKHQNDSLEETRRHNKAEEGISASKAASGGADGTTAEIRNAKTFFPALYAKDPAKALAAFKKLMEKEGGLTQTSDGVGGMNVIDHRTNELYHIDRSGKKTVFQSGDSEDDKPTIPNPTKKTPQKPLSAF